MFSTAVVRCCDTRSQEVVRRMEAPTSFGEVALVHDDVRTATVATTGLDVAERYRRPAKPS